MHWRNYQLKYTCTEDDMAANRCVTYGHLELFELIKFWEQCFCVYITPALWLKNDFFF